MEGRLESRAIWNLIVQSSDRGAIILLAPSTPIDQIYKSTAMKPVSKRAEGNKLIAIIGDEDTVTGFLLTGIGERNVKGETNYLIVDDKSTKQDVEGTFKKFLKDPMISVILITQDSSEKFVKHLIADREEIYPVILEIPSKERAYEPAKDTVMQRAHRLLYGSEIQ